MKVPPLPAATTRQRGIAALELSLVVVLFFIILFGIISFGGLFVVQQALSRAAENGARVALLSTQVPTSTGGVSPPSQTQACQAVAESVAWLTVRLAQMGQGPVGCTLTAPQACAYAAGVTCSQVVVTYQNYREYPLIPELLPLGNWMQAMFGPKARWIPEDLSAVATVQVGKVPPGT